MSKPLKDPELPPGAIVETYEDGGALRNDGVKLTPASQNPWYVLATVAGEQEGERFDEELHVENRHAWNRACARLGSGFSVTISKFLNASHDQIVHETNRELDLAIDRALRKRANCRAVSLTDFSQIEFERLFFPNGLCMRGFYVPLPLALKSSSVGRRLDLSQSWFRGEVAIEDCYVEGPGLLGSSNHLGHIEIEDFAVRNSFYCMDMHVKAGIGIDGLSAQSVFFDSLVVGGDCELDRLRVGRFSMRHADCAMEMSLAGNVHSRLSLQAIKTGHSCKLDGLFVKGDTDISDAEFGGYFSAVGSRFEKSFRSENTTYEGHSKFGPLSSFGNANFNSSRFANKTSFWASYFLKSAPRFFQTELHGDTKFSLDQQYYPEPNKANASDDADAYSRLRHVAKSNERPEVEHFFFRQEMRCKAVTEGFPDGWFIRAYEAASDFGFSVARPALGLLVAWLVPGFLYLFSYAGRIIDGTVALSLLGSFGLSFANLFSFLGLNRLYFAELIKDFGFGLSFLAGAQTVAGVVLLFFLGLGLRNRFRLK